MFDSKVSGDAKKWEHLDHWLQVIHCMRSRGRPPLGMTNDQYLKLHHDLLVHFEHESAKELTSVEDLSLKLHRCIRPWVHLDSLQQCDKRILRMLDQEVRKVRSKLVPRQYVWSHAFYRVAAVFVVIAAALAIIDRLISGGIRTFALGDRVIGIWQSIDSVRAQLWFEIAESTTNQRLIVLAASIVIIGIFLLRDTRRS